jgi:hypothetical protein
MLRDAICRLAGTATWPCDEINPIWKHGNIDYRYDDLDVSHFSDYAQRFVRDRFDGIAGKQRARTVVEKTCANSLRVAYVARLLPEAKFVLIQRNGWDAVASAVKRWRSPVNLGYTVRKARFVPAADAPYYLGRFLRNRIGQLSDPHGGLKSWGPMTKEIELRAIESDIVSAAATQWSQCATFAVNSLEQLEQAWAATVRYEDFVEHPGEELRRVADSLSLKVMNSDVESAVAGIESNRVGHGALTLKAAGESDRIAPIISAALIEAGYGDNAISTSEHAIV